MGNETARAAEVEEDDLSIRDALAAAIDESSDDGGEETSQGSEQDSAEGEESAHEANGNDEGGEEGGEEREDGRDNKGRFRARAKPGEAQEQQPVEGQGEEFQTGTDQPQKQAKAQALRAPQSWKPLMREKFGRLDRDVQEEILRRDTETSRALQQSAEARQHHEQFRQIVGPFEGMIRAEGADPIRAVGSLLRTAMMLRTAPVPHKAEQIANMVAQFLPGAEGLQHLDRALHRRLTGQGAAPGQGQPGEYRDPRLDQLLARVDTINAQRRSEREAKQAADLQKFAESHEFFEDVKDSMETILAVAERKGLQISQEEAYTRACKLDPQISEVLAQREAAKAAKQQRASTQRARVASSSVPSRPAQRDTEGDEEGDDLRDTIRKSAAESARRNR